MAIRSRRRIRQVDVDFLCLSIFGCRYLPRDMAERIALRRDLYHAAAGHDRQPRLLGFAAAAGPAETLEALAV